MEQSDLNGYLLGPGGGRLSLALPVSGSQSEAVKPQSWTVSN